MLFDKKGVGNMDVQQLLLIVFLVGGIALIGDTLGFFNITGDAGDGAGGGQDIRVEVTSGDCTVDQTTYNTKHFNKYVTGTALSTEFSHLFLSDGSGLGDQGQFSDGQTKTVSPGNKLTIYAGENSSTRYTQKFDSFIGEGGAIVDEVPCKGTLDVVAYLAPFDGAPSVSWKNDEGSVKAEQDLAADELYSYEYSIKASSNLALGNPYLKDACNTDKFSCNRVCYQFNTTVLDNVRVKASNVNGVAFSSQSISAPRDISNNASSTGMGATQNTFSCWTFPPLEDGEKWTVTDLEVDTAGTAPADGLHSINVSVATVDYDLNADTSVEIIGVEDEDFNSLGNGPIYLVDPIGLD